MIFCDFIFVMGIAGKLWDHPLFHMVWTIPRLSTALRAFGTVSEKLDVAEDAKYGKDIFERKALELERQSRTCISWAKISTAVQRSAKAEKNEVADIIKQLLACAKAIGNFCTVLFLY